jgi:hypothetical protein
VPSAGDGERRRLCGSLGTGEAQVSLARGKERGRPGREASTMHKAQAYEQELHRVRFGSPVRNTNAAGAFRRKKLFRCSGRYYRS